jgi:outer membrane protein TolC
MGFEEQSAHLEDAGLAALVVIARLHGIAAEASQLKHAAATDGHVFSEAQLAAGVGDILELLNAQSLLSDANRQRIQALTDWRAARIDLAAKMGNLELNDLRRESH